MTDTAYQHLAALDDPARPYRRVYACPATGKFVKLHTFRETPAFGMVVFRITGSECDETGAAQPGRIVQAEHLVQFASDSDAGDLNAAVEAGRLYMVAKTERAALNADAADLIAAGGVAPPRDLAREKAALRQRVLAEAARRTQQSVALYLTVTQLAAVPESERTPDQVLQLLQHAHWAADREAVEAVRAVKVEEIDALDSLAAVDAYDVAAGWPV